MQSDDKPAPAILTFKPDTRARAGIVAGAATGALACALLLLAGVLLI